MLTCCTVVARDPLPKNTRSGPSAPPIASQSGYSCLMGCGPTAQLRRDCREWRKIAENAGEPGELERTTLPALQCSAPTNCL
jgi:hypothetical protein